MEYQDQTLVDTRVQVDGNKYSNCRFDRCAITFCGGAIPHIMDCTFNDCSWSFEDAAERTLQFMNLLYHGTGDHGRELIERTIEMIRQPMRSN